MTTIFTICREYSKTHKKEKEDKRREIKGIKERENNRIHYINICITIMDADN